MTESKNGILLVVIATIVTSVLILMTTREVTVPSGNQQIAAVEKETAQVGTIETNNEKQQMDAAAEVTAQSVDSVAVVEQVAAPESPVASQALITSSAPKGPFNKASVGTNQETKVEVSATLNNITATATQHELLNHIIQPIWMDQKLGDFKSLEQDGVVFNMMPSSPDGLQGENPTKVVTSKSDKFAPTSISGNYNYQQMPMYNGGYYIAPMPSYLMPSMLPGTPVINNKK
ncbi:MAG: hypothetical protein V7749_13135 [Cocleimonas sp.]